MVANRVILPVALLLGIGVGVAAPAATSNPSAASTAAMPLATLQHRAATGDASAEYALGYRLAGSKNPADKAEAIAWYRKAAEQGNADAEWAIGSAYVVGAPLAGIRHNVPTGLKWMHKSLNHGVASAKRMEGYGFILDMYGAHTGNKQQMQDGVIWLQRSARAGSTEAMAMLGMASAFGKLGMAKDTASAKRLLLKASHLGNTDAEAIFGKLYIFGTFGHSHAKDGLPWLRKAAQHGHVDAEGVLAYFLVSGKNGIPTNAAEGVRWGQKAAAKGGAAGYYALGYAYQYGDGEPKNPTKAWYDFAVAKRLDRKHELEHVDEHMSEVAGKLSATELDKLQAKVSKIPLPKKNHQT